MHKSITLLTIICFFLSACGSAGPSNDKVELDAKEYMENMTEGYFYVKAKLKKRELLAEDRAKFEVEMTLVRLSKQPSNTRILAARMVGNNKFLNMIDVPVGSEDGGKVIANYRKENNNWKLVNIDF